MKRIALLYKLLGNDVILIPIRTGKKIPVGTAWQKTTLAKSKTKRWQRRLSTGNIGVLLGERGNGIVTIDCDTDEFAEEMIAENPWLSETLCTRGARGCNFWLRMEGTFPDHLKPLITSDGMKLGEWRAGGGQTIISGKHPDGCEYRFARRVPIRIVPFDSIRWPKRVKAPPKAKQEDHSPIPHSNTVTQTHSHPETQSRSNTSRGDGDVVGVLDVQPFLPAAEHQNDHCVFQMARAILDVERNRGRPLTLEEARTVFVEWYRQNQFLRPGESRDDYYMKFTRALAYAKVPLSEATLKSAIAAAATEPPPPEVAGYEDARKSRLICIMWQLQCRTTPKPFFLAARDAADAIGVDPTTAHQWMVSFCELRTGFLDCGARGSLAARKANEYIFRRVKATPGNV